MPPMSLNLFPIAAFLPPREIAKSFSANGMIGRGGGDRIPQPKTQSPLGQTANGIAPGRLPWKCRIRPTNVVFIHRGLLVGVSIRERWLHRTGTHDRDSVYGDIFRQRVPEMAIREVLTAPRSPWQSPYVERLIGSVRQECLDHLIVLYESSLRHTLKSYFDYYHWARTHLSLEKDAPETRPVQPPQLGSVVELPEVGGLHHRYERRTV